MPLWLVRCGPGPARAEAAAQSLLARTRPRALLSCGFCGGLDPGARVAEVVVGSEAVSPEGEVLRADPALVALALEAGARPGRILTVDRIVRFAADKQAAFRAHGARVVDMETLALARAAARQGVPWLAVRAVGDTADFDLPLDFEACQDSQGEVRVLPLALASLGRPGRLPRLLRLARDTRRAGAALARFLAGFLDRLARWPS
jgi:adenosylhomocysteine nucleosidase